jgi:hypothetical protein
MSLEKVDPDDLEKLGHMRAFFGPHQIDSQIRQAVQTCWMILPPDRKNVDAVEKEIRRIVDRALRDLREDSQSFGME